MGKFYQHGLQSGTFTSAAFPQYPVALYIDGSRGLTQPNNFGFVSMIQGFTARRR